MLAIDLGWQTLENGALLTATEEEGFEVLVSCDQNLRYQQNLKDRKLAVVVLSTNAWRMLRPVASKIASIVDFAQRAHVIYVDIAELSS